MRNKAPVLFRPAHQQSRSEAGAARLAAWRAAWRAPEGQQPAPGERSPYDKDWRALRARVLAEEPWCRLCLAQGVQRRSRVGDHIETVRARPDLRLARSNIQALCWPCHNAKTNRQDGGLGKPKRRQPYP